MKAKRLLALLLVLCLSVSLLALPVSADEYNTFSSFKELKSLVKKYKDSTEMMLFEYVGTDTLVIKEDISIPESMYVICMQAPITVPKGVTLDVVQMTASTMTIKGTVNAQYLDIAESLAVSGKLNISSSLYLYSMDTKLSGEQNINLDEYASITYSSSASTLNDLVKIVNAAKADTNAKHHYSAYVDSKITISKDLTIPANLGVSFSKAVTVAKGVKLTVNGDIYLQAATTVKGSLVNNSFVMISNVKEYNLTGKLTIASGGSYSGNGYLNVYSPEIDDPSELLVGINLKNYEVFEYEEYDQWVLTPKEEIEVTAPKVTAKNTASTGKVKLSWKAIDGAEKYIVYRATSKNGTYKKLKTTTKLAYTDSSATVGKTYYYKVKAVGASSDNTATSSAVKGVRDLPNPEISVKVKSNGDPKVSWEKVEGATKYYVYRATSKDGEYTRIKSTTKLAYSDTTAKAGKTYYYMVKAIHSTSAANSAASNIVKAKAK